MYSVRRHYRAVAAETASQEPADFTHLQPPIVITPIANWGRITEKALRFFSYTAVA